MFESCKYLKYKKKYLDLRGGAPLTWLTATDLQRKVDRLVKSQDDQQRANQLELNYFKRTLAGLEQKVDGLKQAE